MIDVSKFKRHIIQVALQGKLTKQESSTESIDSLLPYYLKETRNIQLSQKTWLNMKYLNLGNGV